MNAIIIVLGYKNSPTGELHAIAQQRAVKAAEIASQQSGNIICTGGFGENFNQSATAHGMLIQHFLVNLGVNRARFLSHAPSRNTYEDGRFCADIIETQVKTGKKTEEIHLITSDFHIRRGFLWLHHFCPQLRIVCHPAKTQVSSKEMQTLLAHEDKAIANFYRDFPETPDLNAMYQWNNLQLPA